MTILVRLLTTPSQRSYLVKFPASRTNPLRLDSAISVQTEGAPGSVTTESWKLEKTSKIESNPKGNSDRSTTISLSTTSTCFWNISRDGEWDLWLPDTSWQFRQTFSIKKEVFLKLWSQKTHGSYETFLLLEGTQHDSVAFGGWGFLQQESSKGSVS